MSSSKKKGPNLNWLKCVAFIKVPRIKFSHISYIKYNIEITFVWSQFIASQVRKLRTIMPKELLLVSVYILTLPDERVVGSGLILITEVINFILQISTNVTMEEILVT